MTDALSARIAEDLSVAVLFFTEVQHLHRTTNTVPTSSFHSFALFAQPRSKESI